MPILTAQTDFVVGFAEELEEGTDLILLPENSGVNALRELHYPEDLLAPIVYDDRPDKWENFDTFPLTNRPLTKTEMTLQSNKIARWPGYYGDVLIREIWSGKEKESRMFPYFLRRLLEYQINSINLAPGEYVTWYPKDRTTQGYKIVIEGLTVAGSVLSFDYLAIRNNLITGEVIFSFRIVGLVT